MNIRALLYSELIRSGKNDLAKKYELHVPPDNATISQVLKTISLHLKLGQVERVDALAERLLTSARLESPSKLGVLTTSSVSGSVSLIDQRSKAGREFINRHRFMLIDALLANAIRLNVKSRTRGGGISDGTVRAYAQTGTGSYRSFQLKAPLSTSLVNQTMVTELVSTMQAGETVDATAVQMGKFSVPKEILEHLEKPLADAPPHEQKSRQVLAAFAHWWEDRPEYCYEGLIKLCKQFPDDVDLQIERARLASELGKPRLALDALDSFDPLDSKMLVRKEMAALNLASRLGDVERSKQAAERLFGMRMDSNTQMALADQLQRLGMKDKAAAVLRRLRGGRARSESTDIKIANSFLASDDKESAGEVAYALLRRINSGRSRSTSNQDYYRDKAISILKSTGRLETLIQQAEMRLKSTPSSTRARTELAELYTAVGRTADANKLWAELTGKDSSDPRQMLVRAEALTKARKYKESARLYLKLFKQKPQLLERNYSKLYRAASQGRCSDEMFQQLVEIEPNSLPLRSVGYLLRAGGSRNFTDAKRKFLAHVLKGTNARSNANSFLRLCSGGGAGKGSGNS